MSGGRATLRSRKGRGAAVFAQVGDISAIAEVGHPFLRLFTIECKFYKDLKLESSLTYGKKGFLEDIWYKPLGEAQASGRDPFVVLRQNLRDELVWTTEAGLAMLRASVRPGMELKCFGIYPLHGIHTVHLRDMVLACDPVVLRGLAGPMPEPTAPPTPPASHVSRVPLRRLFADIEPVRPRRRFADIEVVRPRHRFAELIAERKWADELQWTPGSSIPRYHRRDLE